MRQMVQPEEPSEQAPKFVRGELLADLDKPGDSVVVALGGRGGLGDSALHASVQPFESLRLNSPPLSD